jgi:4-nitrophenyl phosphatase
MQAIPPQRPRLVIFDLDGVVYRGNEPVPGAAQLIGELRARKVQVRYATNNSMASREAYVTRLDGLGIEAGVADVTTSTSATIGYLQRHQPRVRRILGAGSAGMVGELRAAGFEVAATADLASPDYQGQPLDRRYDAVVVGLDQGYDYQRVAVAATAIRDGAAFVATNADLRYPTPRGFLPGAGSLVAAIRAAAGDAEPIVIGKPAPAIFGEILEEAGIGPEAAVVLGDNPDADVVGARRAGIFAILVLTGVADAELASQLTGERRPDLVVADHHELGRVFDAWLS